MKKKFLLLSFLSFMIFAISSCSNRITLLFLNWGEYVDESLLDEFEELHNCNVMMDLGESNEIFYSKVFAGTTVYDVVCPSDYMVMKMYQKNLIEKIDFNRLKNYDGTTDVREGVLSIREDMIQGTDENIVDYYVPYLWGTWGTMYSTKKPGLEDAIINSENQWAPLFDRNATPAGTRIAMYDSHQHAYYAACRYLNKSVSEELPKSDLDQIGKLVEKMKFNSWGTDIIKKQIVADNLDVGFMWTGDFLYYYAEQAADRTCRALLDNKIANDEIVPFLDGITDNDDDPNKFTRTYKGLKDYEIGFDIFIPEDTIAFCDNLVVVKDKQRSNAKTDLIYEFIDFMCSQSIKLDMTLPDIDKVDPETISEEELAEIEDNYINPANTNTQYVCYDTPFDSIYHQILDLTADIDEFDADALTEFKSSAKSSDPKSFNDSDFYWAAYNYALAIAFKKYYPEDGKVGSILGCFDRKYVNQINNTFNNARA